MLEFSGEKAYSSLPAIIIFTTFIAAVITFFLTRVNRKAGEIFTVITIAALFGAIFSMYGVVKGGGVVSGSVNFLSIPFAISFRVDMLSFFLGLLAVFLWLLAAIHSIGYMAREHAHDRYYAFLLLALGGCLGCIFAGDMLGLFVFFEIIAISGCVLISHEENPYAIFAGTKYLFMSLAAGLLLFFAIVITYYLAGTLSFNYFGLITENSTLAFIAFICFLLGFGVKAGIFPVHIWLPDAHPAAPSPVSALLSGMMIKIGAYGLIRVFYQVYGFTFLQEVGWHNIALVLATVTILIGSALALVQDDIKRRLAYSSVAQIGYVVLGLALLSEMAFVGSIYHIFTHAFMKGALFLIAGAIIVQAGERRISRFGGVGRKMPLTMIAFALCSFSIVGIPPFNGFISKWQLCLGALETGQPFFVVLLIVSSLLNAAYYFPIVITAFFAAAPRHTAETESVSSGHPDTGIGVRWQEAPLNMLVPIMILAIGCVAFVLMPQNWPLEMAKVAVSELFVRF
ncbi:MAG TPA: monovalent cation/H+ antiporter subunit D family protein [Firmicutes bacterium]|nr:monovalent cation/H+ antiporter subunit D family protein [Bacillota bacterium]